MPGADILHVGSTAVPHSLTKGDLDTQVCVTPELFLKAVQILSRFDGPNKGSVKTDCFRAFKDDSTVPHDRNTSII